MSRLVHIEYNEYRSTYPAMATRSLRSFGSLRAISSKVTIFTLGHKRKWFYLLVVCFGNFVEELFWANLHNLDSLNNFAVDGMISACNIYRGGPNDIKKLDT